MDRRLPPGRVRAAAAPALLQDIEDDAAAMRKRYVASKRHTIQVDFDDYLLALAKERGPAPSARGAGLRAAGAAPARRRAADRASGRGAAA